MVGCVTEDMCVKGLNVKNTAERGKLKKEICNACLM